MQTVVADVAGIKLDVIKLSRTKTGPRFQLAAGGRLLLR